MLLSELTAGVRRLALVGLAKNTGKTMTLNTLLGELEAAGRRAGVTSVGRDGEARDVIDARIEKPLVRLAAGSLVATTDALLSGAGLEYELLERTGMRTPLGEVLVARMLATGTVEIAGPSAAAEVSLISEAMLGHGAEQVLIDGAIDRRAASSPVVSDGLVMSTGAVLGEDLEEVVRVTREAVALVRLPGPGATPQLPAGLLGLLDGAGSGGGLLVSDQLESVELPARFALTAPAEDAGRALDGAPKARWLCLAGAVPEVFVAELAAALRRSRRELTLVAGDPTHLFLSARGPDHYARQGLELRVRRPIELLALTVNPVAPRSHELDSAGLRSRLAAELSDVEIFDVCHPDYRRAAGATQAPAAAAPPPAK